MQLAFQAFLALFIYFGGKLQAHAAEQYDPELTEHGSVNIQGYWVVGSLTPMERPDNFDGLNTTAERAENYATSVLSSLGEFQDPDVYLNGFSELDKIGEWYRTSIVIQPANGRIPYTKFGEELVAWNTYRQTELFDHPEQRNLFERCLGSFGFPPMRPWISDMPRQIVQNREYVMIYTEDPGGARIIKLDAGGGISKAGSYFGDSRGHWEDKTLVISTSNFRDDDPARLTFGRAVLVGKNSEIQERFTLLSQSQLLYQFTMIDDLLYSEPWIGEFSLRKTEKPTYEYSCHEGNYSLPGILIGGRLEQESMGN